MHEIATVASGQTPKGITSHISKNGDVMWFKVSSMNDPSNSDGMVNSEFRINDAEANRLGLRRFPIGTIIFPKRGGAIATNKKRKLGVAGGLDLNLMGVTATGVLTDYLWFWFQGLDLASISNGSNVPQINHGDVEPLIVPIPPREEQTEIVRVLSQAVEQINLVSREARRAANFLQRLDQAVLTKAFAGDLVASGGTAASRGELLLAGDTVGAKEHLG